MARQQVNSLFEGHYGETSRTLVAYAIRCNHSLASPRFAAASCILLEQLCSPLNLHASYNIAADTLYKLTFHGTESSAMVTKGYAKPVPRKLEIENYNAK